MSEPIAALLILAPPEYRPNDDYPAVAPDDPRWLFYSYDDYYEWLDTREGRVVIHNPLNGESTVKRIAALDLGGVYNAGNEPFFTSQATVSPVENGLVVVKHEFVGGIIGYKVAAYFAGYAVDGELAPEVELLTRVEAEGAWVSSDGHQVVMTTLVDRWSGTSKNALMIPSPRSGETRLTEQLMPNLNTGGGSTAYLVSGINLVGSTITLVAEAELF